MIKGNFHIVPGIINLKLEIDHREWSPRGVFALIHYAAFAATIESAEEEGWDVASNTALNRIAINLAGYESGASVEAQIAEAVRAGATLQRALTRLNEAIARGEFAGNHLEFA